MIILCIKIFFARILDVSIGTVRTVLTIRGRKIVTFFLAFFEVLVWYYVAREALNTTNVVYIPISYSLGYATGSLIGSLLSGLFINKYVELRVVTTKNLDLVLRKLNFLYSKFKLEKSYDNKNRYMYLINVKNKSKKYLINELEKVDKNIFVTLSETNQIINGIIR